jgi:hypothetical protein
MLLGVMTYIIIDQEKKVHGLESDVRYLSIVNELQEREQTDE